jgi:hypothetical protein
MGCAVGISAILKDDTKTVGVTVFTDGGVDEKTGKFEECEDAICTEDFIECAGLKVTPDFDSSIQYQIFWYNMDKIYFEHTKLTDEPFSDSVPECAKYCRIMIVPGDSEETEDGKIQFWEVYKIANKVKIEVSKDQSVLPVDYYQEALLKTAKRGYTPTSVDEPYTFYENKWIYHDPNGATFLNSMQDYLTADHCVVKLNCEDWSKVQIGYNDTYDGEHHIYVDYIDASGTIIDRVETFGYIGSTDILEIPEGAKYVCFNVYQDLRPITINPYLPR